ncbi:hypothetical protein NMD1_01356 [Novosphingobium sp. MD-1]|nr:hypothetical protein NMD1_01356 [Novosphingobium sp. MD-1]
MAALPRIARRVAAAKHGESKRFVAGITWFQRFTGGLARFNPAKGDRIRPAADAPVIGRVLPAHPQGQQR